MRRLFILVVTLAALPLIRTVILGGFPFWFDPARDLLLALDNLKKITLLGPPTGIPGLFYGPYWIWLLSLPLVLTRDPRFVVFMVQTLPYLVVFPLFLWQLRKTIGGLTILSLWLLFILSFGNYATYLWNPHLAPLFFLLLAYLVFSKRSAFLIGIVAGLILNFHFSLGLAAITASFLISVTNFRRFFAVGMAVALVLVPFAVFETRHGFNQTSAFYHALTNSLFYNSAVVGQIGLSKGAILGGFQQALASLFQISPWALLVVEIPLAVLLVNLIRKKKVAFESSSQRLLIFLFLTLVFLAYLFFSSKNPIWDYHFIGVETIFLLLLGLLAAKIPILSRLLFYWSTILLLGTLVDFIRTPVPHYERVPSFQSKKAIVESVFQDALSKPFAVYAYSSALYTFDFDYLFSEVSKEKGEPLPETDLSKVSLVYLIIPESPWEIAEDFVHYRTPDTTWQTVDKHTTGDNTLIIKRERSEPR